MSREVFFLPAAHLDKRSFLLKDCETLQQMDPDSDDIQCNLIVVYY